MNWLRRMWCRIFGHGLCAGIMDETDAVPIVRFTCIRCGHVTCEATVLNVNGEVEFRFIGGGRI